LNASPQLGNAAEASDTIKDHDKNLSFESSNHFTCSCHGTKKTKSSLNDQRLMKEKHVLKSKFYKIFTCIFDKITSW